jgi:hypothetical protein
MLDCGLSGVTPILQLTSVLDQLLDAVKHLIPWAVSPSGHGSCAAFSIATISRFHLLFHQFSFG